MRNFFLSFAFVTLGFQLFSQEDNRYIDYGLIRVQGNLALGKSLAFDATNMYWCGDIDYYLKNNISVRAGYYYFFSSFGTEKVFQHNHTVYLGAAYHFPTNNHLDPYIAFLPSYVVSRVHPKGIYENTPSNYKVSVNPTLGISAGATFYANRFFNVFANVHYTYGKHFSDIAAIPLDELKVSFGLGYMIWARKKYFRFRKPEAIAVTE